MQSNKSKITKKSNTMENILLGVFIAYTVLLFTITFITARKADSASFFSGNKKSPWFIVAYGMIGASAIKYLKQTTINFDNEKTIWIFAIMLMIGTSGLAINYGSFNITGICLAIIVGIILNLILREKNG